MSFSHFIPVIYCEVLNKDYCFVVIIIIIIIIIMVAVNYLYAQCYKATQDTNDTNDGS